MRHHFERLAIPSQEGVWTHKEYIILAYRPIYIIYIYIYISFILLDNYLATSYNHYIYIYYILVL